MLVEKYSADLQNVSKKIQNRIEMGTREISTLVMLAKALGYDFNKKDALLVDLGCGDQHLIEGVKKLNFNYKGLDIKDLNFEFDKLPFESNSVDIVVSLAVIEHISNPNLFLSEIYRVLKKDGFFYLSTPNFQMDSRNFYNDPTHCKPYTPISLEIILRMYQFSNINTFPGLRCKNLWFYEGKYRFLKGYYLFPFKGNVKWVPRFLKGKSTSIIALAFKN